MRLLLLIGFAAAIFASQAIWLTYAPIASRAAGKLGVEAARIGYFVSMYPAAFLLLSIPSGILLDLNLTRSLHAGVLLTAAGGLLRLLKPLSYRWLFICQLMAATGQPFLLNGITPFAHSFFEKSRRPLVISLLTTAMYAGMIYPTILPTCTGGVLEVERLVALPTCFSLTFLLPHRTHGRGRVRAGIHQFKQVARLTHLWKLAGIFSYTMAVFNSIMAWIQPVLENVNLGNYAGPAMALLLLSGMAGSALIPKLAGLKAKKYMLRLTSMVVAGVMVVFTFQASPLTLMAGMALTGFLVMTAYPLTIELIEHMVEKPLQGTSTGFTMFMGRLYSLLMILMLQRFIGRPGSFYSLMAAASLVGVVPALNLNDNIKS